MSSPNPPQRRCASRSRICSGGPARSATWTFPRRIADLGNGAAKVPDDEPVRVEGTLERIAEGIVVRGTVHAPWQAVCSRCLQPVEGTIDVHVDELFETDAARRRDLPARRRHPRPRAARPRRAPARAADRAAVPRRLRRDLCPSCGADRNETACECRHRRIRSPLGGPAVARTLNLDRSLEWPSRSAR